MSGPAKEATGDNSVTKDSERWPEVMVFAGIEAE
jgi:hypothetical protein